MVDFQKLGEVLNEVVNDKMIIRVGNYTGDYYAGDGEFITITGELFIKTNADTIFRVVSDDSSIVDDFDVIGDDAIITPINKIQENAITYDDVDVSKKSSLRAYFPKDEIGIEMFECVQSVPVRFRQDALDLFDDPEDRDRWTMHAVSDVWGYFLMEIIGEMTNEEKIKYYFE